MIKEKDHAAGKDRRRHLNPGLLPGSSMGVFFLSHCKVHKLGHYSYSMVFAPTSKKSNIAYIDYLV
jgi:hypothetical protein